MKQMTLHSRHKKFEHMWSEVEHATSVTDAPQTAYLQENKGETIYSKPAYQQTPENEP